MLVSGNENLIHISKKQYFNYIREWRGQSTLKTSNLALRIHHSNWKCSIAKGSSPNIATLTFYQSITPSEAANWQKNFLKTSNALSRIKKDPLKHHFRGRERTINSVYVDHRTAGVLWVAAETDISRSNNPKSPNPTQLVDTRPGQTGSNSTVNRASKHHYT